MKLTKSFKYAFYTILLLLLTSIASYAGPGGSTDPIICDPEDVTPACQSPLDTYVYILAAIAIIFTYYHLQKQKKSLLIK